MKSALNFATAPRALMGSPRANATPADMVRQLNASFADHSTRLNARIDGLEAGLQDMNVRSAAGDMNGGMVAAIAPDPEYSRLFASHIRTGQGEQEIRTANATGERALIQAALSTGDPSQGGAIAPTEWDRRVIQSLRTFSPMRALATIVNTTQGAFSTVFADGLLGSGWVGETAARPQTTTPSFAPLVFPHGEIYANPAATQRILDDAGFDLENYLANELAATFSVQEGIAFITGDGVNKPKGLLQYLAPEAHPGGAIPQVASGVAAEITPDSILALIYSLPAPYRANASFLMSSETASILSRFKDTTGRFIWSQSLAVGQPSTLGGFPVYTDENLPGIAAGSTPIVFGDFKRGYLIADRTGIRVLRDPYTNKPYVTFYTTKRVGGGVLDPNALRLLRVSAA
ncbi:phage major capsid protein [Brevundimonas sp. DC300-4]|uniref:phage major capsid protein n=1 Tax=Brevundimonas sp. DC300-4 TaxID=2804594 RepID=UPI003CF2A5B5